MSRQAQRVHKTFYRLKLRANFFIGKGFFEKTSFCTARPLGGSGIPLSTRHNRFIAPWTVVRSDEYVNKKLIADKVRTRSGDHVAVGYQAGTLPAQPNNVLIGSEQTAINPAQPSSDNGVSGPTS